MVAEVLDNAMDEAVAGFANRIDIELATGNIVTVRDNGRGIPVDPHPKFKNKSALEVILTTLHSGGKFSGKAYATFRRPAREWAVSVVNALSDDFSRRGRPRPADLAPVVYAAARRPDRSSMAVRCRTGAAPRSPSIPIPRFSETRSHSARASSTSWRARRAFLFRGRRNPLGLRSGAAQGKRPDPAERDLPFPGRARRLSDLGHRRAEDGDCGTGSSAKPS